MCAGPSLWVGAAKPPLAPAHSTGGSRGQAAAVPPPSSRDQPCAKSWGPQGLATRPVLSPETPGMAQWCRKPSSGTPAHQAAGGASGWSCHLLLMRTCEAEKDGRTEKSEQVAPGLKHWGSLSHAQHPRPSGCILRTGSGDGGLPRPHLRRVFTSSTGPCVRRGDPAVPGPGHFSRKQTQGRWPGRHGRAVAPGPPGPSRETPTCLFVCFLICIYFFVWLNQVSAAAHETFN